MALNANNSKNAGGSFKRQNMEPGTYPARLVSVVDLGLQPQRAYQGQEKPDAYEFMLTYEFVDEFMKDENGDDIEDKPRWLTEFMPLYSLSSERAKSTVRYNAFDPNHVHEGNWPDLLGTPVLVTVVNNPGKNDVVYDNIAAVASMRDKDAQKCPDLINLPMVFDLDEPDLEVFNALPTFAQKKIKDNLEFPGSKLADMLATNAEEAVADDDEVDEDENPY